MERIGKCIGDLHHNIRTKVNAGADPKRYLNYTQFQIIIYLLEHKNEEVCQKDLEIETKLKKASITGTLDAMEEKGFIKRVQSKEDKRKNFVRVTEKVENLKKEFENRTKQIDKQLVNNISKEELDVFFGVIDKMNKNLAKEK